MKSSLAQRLASRVSAQQLLSCSHPQYHVWLHGPGRLRPSSVTVSASPQLRVSRSATQILLHVSQEEATTQAPSLHNLCWPVPEGNGVDRKAMGGRNQWSYSDHLVTYLLIPTSTTQHWYLYTNTSCLRTLNINFQHRKKKKGKECFY